MEGRLKVSVVIPTYNCAPLLKKALESVVSQTFKDWEALVINNFSNDNTVDVVNSFNDPRISIYNFKNHGVIAASRNLGIEKAKGEFIAFLDSDDYWRAEKLERCLVFLNQGYELICHGERHFSHSGYSKDVYYGPNRFVNYDDMLLRGNCFSTSALICSKKRLVQADGFVTSKEINTAEDYDLWLRLIKNETSAAIIPEILGDYRIHESSASSSLMKHCLAVRTVVHNHYHSIKRPSLKQRLRFVLRSARIQVSSARQLLRKGEYKKALDFILLKSDQVT